MEIRYRLAVVTGAGSGLGREIAVALARRGASVLVADRDAVAADETVDLLRQSRVVAWACQVDLTDAAEARLLAGRARDLGGADILVNNAGAWSSGSAQYPDAPVEVWSRALDLDLRTPMLLTQAFLADLTLRRSPDAPAAVVNIASSAALGSDPYGSPEYAAAKAGLIRLTTALGSPEVARRARVMAIVPGWIGLPRAHEQWARLSPDQQAALPPLIPPATVCGAVLDLIETGRAGEVVELLG